MAAREWEHPMPVAEESGWYILSIDDAGTVAFVNAEVYSTKGIAQAAKSKWRHSADSKGLKSQVFHWSGTQWGHWLDGYASWADAF